MRSAFYDLVKILIAFFGVMMPICSYAVLAERKISAFIQDRIGPNRVGPWGLLQPLPDTFKLLLKEDVTPAHVNKLYYILAPCISMAPAILLIAVIPFGPDVVTSSGTVTKMVIADLNIGILWTFAIASLGVYGIVIAGWSSNSKYPFLGGLRSSAQM